MKTLTKAVLAGAGVLALSTASASAAIVCNDDGDCWHVHGSPHYSSGISVHVHPDNWKWGHGKHFRWREHAGHGYWRNNVWVDIK